MSQDAHLADICMKNAYELLCGQAHFGLIWTILAPWTKANQHDHENQG